jgi:hypothetical protein
MNVEYLVFTTCDGSGLACGAQLSPASPQLPRILDNCWTAEHSWATQNWYGGSVAAVFAAPLAYAFFSCTPCVPLCSSVTPATLYDPL